MKLSPIDKHILDEISGGLGLYQSDVMRLALWNYVNVPKDGLLKVTLKELARTREQSFKMDMLKELEKTNNRQIFFIDGFRTMLERYHTKYAPLEGVRRYVTIKLIALYSLFKDTKQRKDYVDYIKKHYVHYYSNDKKWLSSQINMVRSLKKSEKDKILVKLQEKLPVVKDNFIDFGEHINQEGDVDSNIMKRLPESKQKAIEGHFKRESIRKDARAGFYRNKGKYFKKVKDAGTK